LPSQIHMQDCSLSDPPFPNILHKHPVCPGIEIGKDQLALTLLWAYVFSTINLTKNLDLLT
ncbi:MAG TPA: hypothetical protein VJZ24_00655, partial [Thermodesulfovibrionales bacterium]|nr:hypothetical protein [Thermodesulfovibrionales bacterium]